MFHCPEPHVSQYFQRKRYCDFFIALFLSMVALPIVAVVWLLVRLTSRGPGIYKQVRLGLDGKPFTLHKIRTMRADAEIATGPVWATRNDKRVTLLGYVLRKTHIDEFPQLYNVLKGDLSLVGPHPERPEFVTALEKRIDGYAYRLYVKPGLTGIAQLNHGSDFDLNDVRRKLVLDFEYIEEATFLFDIRVLFCTVLKTLFPCQQAVLKLCRLHRKAETSYWATPLSLINYDSPSDEEHLSKILAKQVTV